MAIAKDRTTHAGRARGMDYATSGGRVLFESTFEGGSFDGWRDHFGAHTPQGALSLTCYPVVEGTHALKISTGARDYASGQLDANISAYKNLSHPRDLWDEDSSGRVSFSGYFAIGGGDAYAFQSWAISMDIQSWDMTKRWEPTLQCEDPWNGNGTTWKIRKDDGSYVTVPGTTSGAVMAGENENKFNFNYVRLTFDIKANSGAGAYVEAQINHKVFDLSALGAGGAARDPQGSGSDHIGSFRGGFNCGINVSRATREAQQDVWPFWVVADKLVATLEDPA